MRELSETINEDIGRRACKEDNCTGRFFHGALGNLTSQVSDWENLKRKRLSNISNCENYSHKLKTIQ